MWSRDDCNKLVYEVVSKIFEAEFHPLSVRLSQDLLAQLEDQVPEWIVLVHPNRYKEVAKAVYKDLCNGKKKIHVKHAALAQRGFSSTVLEAIHRNMVVPLKRKCTLSTFLRSLCSVFCRH
ncbi:hypothetical protein NL108_007805 [Boleophthalmus pectinirostris]|nr:hypothetical protein NL108_007805 [Boleophthalmus pectinirostris]